MSDPTLAAVNDEPWNKTRAELRRERIEERRRAFSETFSRNLARQHAAYVPPIDAIKTCIDELHAAGYIVDMKRLAKRFGLPAL